VAERAGKPTFSDAALAGDQNVAPLANEVAARELEESAIETALDVVIDILDARIPA
jgi:hypothetical protein